MELYLYKLNPLPFRVWNLPLNSTDTSNYMILIPAKNKWSARPDDFSNLFIPLAVVQ